MIVLDSCKVNYQTLLVTCLKSIIRLAKHAWREKNIKSECEFIGLKNNRLNHRCKECKGTSAKPMSGLIETSPSVYQFCDGDLNKFVLVLRKGFYPYEYMDSWEKIDEILPPKEDFYSELTLEDISDKGYAHAQKVWEWFEIRNRGEYHDLYVQSDTLLLADVFEKFRDKCIEIYGLDLSHFLSAPGLAWQACLKNKCKFRIVSRHWYAINDWSRN